MITTAKEWREFFKSPGAKATCMSIEWLHGGCPKCGCKKWSVTCDCWAYCMECNKGYNTYYPFTHHVVDELDFTHQPLDNGEE